MRRLRNILTTSETRTRLIFLTGWPQPLKKSRPMSWRPSSNLSGMNSGNSKLYRKCFARSALSVPTTRPRILSAH